MIYYKYLKERRSFTVSSPSRCKATLELFYLELLKKSMTFLEKGYSY